MAGRTKPGVIEKFYRDVVLTHNSDECLVWPFATDHAGYGKMWVNSRLNMVHRVVCTEVHGDPPTPEHETAHSCGVRPCCNWRHIRWATHEENIADKQGHGTQTRGDDHPPAKLTAEKVLRIRELAATNRFSQKEIGVMFDIGQMQVCRIVTRKQWKHV